MRRLVALLPLVAAAVPAQALAAAEVATRADGAVEVRDGGTLLAVVELQTPALRRGQPSLHEVSIAGHRVVELRLPVRGEPRTEVWIAEVGGKAPVVVWRGFAGPRDPDGESAVDVEVGPAGVLEWQTSDTVSRCDGEPARLFPRVWDFGGHRFRPVVSPLPRPATQTITAHRGDPGLPAGRPIAGFRFTGASTTAAAGRDARALAAPVALDDGDPATVWAEGLGGDGRGEFLTARSSAAGYKVIGLGIVPGDASSPAAFRARNRLRRILVALGPGDDQRFEVDFGADPAADPARFRDPYWVPLPKPVEAACVTVVILDVFAGREAAPPKTFGTTAVSDLAVYTELDGPGAAARLVADIAAGAACQARVPLLVSLGEAAVVPTAQAVATASGAGRECLVEALSRLAPAPSDPVVTGAFVAALRAATGSEESLARAALRRAAEPPVAALARALSTDEASDPDRARAARALADLPRAEAAAALVAAVGRGSAPLRTAVVEALGTSAAPRTEPILAALRTGGSDPTRTGDLERALAVAAHDDAAHRDAVLAALRAGLASSDFEVRGRAIGAMGRLGAVEAASDLAALRAHDPDPVVRYLAARELATLPGDAALAALRDAVADVDPRVRATAAEGLGRRRDAAAGALLIAAAKDDGWPFARQAEVQALGHLCGSGAGDLMVRAWQHDVLAVRRAALQGLVRCKDARAPRLLLRTLGRRAENPAMRDTAAALIGETADARLAADTAAALDRLVNESQEDLTLEGVALSTVHALARLGGPHAVAGAASMLKDPRPALQQAAIEALGALCPAPAAAAALQDASKLKDPSLADIAAAALGRCGR